MIISKNPSSLRLFGRRISLWKLDIKQHQIYIFSHIFEKTWFVRMYFCICCVFCTINCDSRYVYRILCIFLYIGTDFKDIVRHLFENSPRGVNNFRTKYFFMICCDLGVLHAPPPPHPHPHPRRQCKSSLPGNTNIEK